MLEETSGVHLVQPSAKVGSLQSTAQESIQMGTEQLLRRRLHNLSPVFPRVQMELIVFLFVPTAPFLSPYTAKKSPAPHAQELPIRYLEGLIRSLLSLLQTEQASQPFLIRKTLQALQRAFLALC